MKAKAQQDAEAALAEPLEVYNTFFLDGQPFIGGDKPSIADIRFAATLEFLRAIDYDFPAWAEEYMSRMEETLGEAYSEPAADVRGYIDYVKSQAATTAPDGRHAPLTPARFLEPGEQLRSGRSRLLQEVVCVAVLDPVPVANSLLVALLLSEARLRPAPGGPSRPACPLPCLTRCGRRGAPCSRAARGSRASYGRRLR